MLICPIVSNLRINFKTLMWSVSINQPHGIVDNWGWCNASLVSVVSGAHPGSSIIVNATPNPAGAYSGPYPLPVGGDKCNPLEDTAWTYFKGIIIVVPEEILSGNR